MSSRLISPRAHGMFYLSTNDWFVGDLKKLLYNLIMDQTQTTSSRKKFYLITLSVLVFIILSIFVFFVVKNTNKKQVIKEQNKGYIPLKLETLPVGNLPEVFPKDIVLEKNAVMSGNYIFKQEDDIKVYTAKYEVSKKPQEMCGIYEKYFKDNGWVLGKARVNTASLSAMSASKDNSNLDVVCSVNSISKKSMLDLTLTVTK